MPGAGAVKISTSFAAPTVGAECTLITKSHAYTSASNIVAVLVKIW